MFRLELSPGYTRFFKLLPSKITRKIIQGISYFVNENQRLAQFRENALNSFHYANFRSLNRGIYRILYFLKGPQDLLSMYYSILLLFKQQNFQEFDAKVLRIAM